MSRINITTEQAISLLQKTKMIHTFRSMSYTLVGAYWKRSELIKAIKNSECEIGGDQCKRMGHGLVVHIGGPLFVEVPKDKIEELEKLMQS